MPSRFRNQTVVFSGAAAAAAPSRVSVYLRRARLIDALRLRLRRHDPSSSSPFPLPSSPLLDSSSAAHALRAAPSPDSALALFRSLPAPLLAHPAPLHALAKRLALARRLPDLLPLLRASRSSSSPIDRLRWLSAAGDFPSSLHLFSSIRSAAVASSPRRHPCTESYNLVIALHASTGSHSAAVATYSQMISDGANPNARTYTIMIDHLVRFGKLDAALKVFDLLPAMRIKRTSKQYNVLAEGLSTAKRFDELRRLLGEMGCDGILPGREVRAAMVVMRAAGHVEGTEEFAKELVPDERIGYAVGADEESGSDDDDKEEEEEEDGGGGANRVRLKPWLDPAALARALDDWDPRDVSDLEAAGFVWTSRLVCKLLRSFKRPEAAWEFFCWVAYQPGGFTHDRHTVSRMIAVLARSGHIELVDRLLSKVISEGILLPFATVRLVVDLYGLSKKADAALKIFRDANSICGRISSANRLLLCSSILRTMTKCKRGNEAMDLLEEMMLEGVLLDIQTFSGLMKYFAEEKDLKSVHKLFGMVRQCRLEPDAYMYRVLIEAYCRHERAALALRMFEEMRSSNMVPDVATKRFLVKSLWKEGKLREAAVVEERCEEIEGGLPAALPGHVWTVSAADFKCVCDVYFSSFADSGEQS